MLCFRFRTPWDQRAGDVEHISGLLNTLEHLKKREPRSRAGETHAIAATDNTPCSADMRDYRPSQAKVTQGGNGSKQRGGLTSAPRARALGSSSAIQLAMWSLE